MIFFNHVPKCAGTSLVNVLAGCFHIDEILTGLILSNRGLIKTNQTFCLLHLPERIFRHAKFVAGHFHDICRLVRCPHAYSVTVLREPVARFRSIAKHALRDPAFHKNIPTIIQPNGAICLDHPDSYADYMRFSMMRSFAALPEDVQVPSQHAEILLEKALAALKAYDLVITEETYDSAINFLVAVLEGASPEEIPRLNEADRLPQPVEPRFPEDLEAKLRALAPWEFTFYEQAVALSKIHRQKIQLAPLEAAHQVRGRLHPKITNWCLDWLNSIKAAGWSERERSADPLFADGMARIITQNNAYIDIPLDGPASYAIRLPMWCSNPQWLTELQIMANNELMNMRTFYPTRPEKHHVIYEGRLDVQPRPGWTRLSFHHPSAAFNANETWLLGASIHLDNTQIIPDREADLMLRRLPA